MLNGGPVVLYLIWQVDPEIFRWKNPEIKKPRYARILVQVTIYRRLLIGTIYRNLYENTVSETWYQGPSKHETLI